MKPLETTATRNSLVLAEASKKVGAERKARSRASFDANSF
jgi:hypothetical protein